MSFGPLMRKDLVLLARRRWWFFARAGIMFVLLIMCFWQLSRLLERMGYGAPPSYLARESFAIFTMSLLVLMALVAPAFGTGALEEARAGGTMDLLRLASISRMRLAMVKLIAASAWPLLISLSLAPFLALWSLWGGTTGIQLIATVVLIAVTGVLLAAFGLLARALVQRANAALGLAYALGATYTLGVPLLLVGTKAPDWLVAAVHAPAAMLLLQDGNGGKYWWMSAVLAGVGIVASGVLAGTALVFRDSRIRTRIEERRRGPGLTRRSRPVWDAALLWKEIRTGGGRSRAWMTRAGWALVTVLLIVSFASQLANEKDWMMLSYLSAFPLVTSLMLGILGAASISSEKEGGTLGPLLLAPHGPPRIVLTKLVGILGRAAPALVLSMLYIPVLSAELRADDIVFVLTMLPVTVLFATFGMLCSVTFRRTAVSVAATFIGGLLQLFAMAWLVDELPGMGNDTELIVFNFLCYGVQVVYVVASIVILEAASRRSV